MDLHLFALGGQLYQVDDIVKILYSGVASSLRIYESKGAAFLFNVRMLIAEFQNLINSKT